MSTEPSSNRPAPEGMPSLLGNSSRSDSGADRSDAQDTRILWALASDSNLAASTHKHRYSGWRWAFAVMLLAAMGVSLAWWNSTTSEPQAQLASAPQQVAPAAVPQQTAIETAATPAAAGSSVAPAASAATGETAGALLIDAPQQAAASPASAAPVTSPLAALVAANEPVASSTAEAATSRKAAASPPHQSKRETAKSHAAAKDKGSPAVASATNTKQQQATPSTRVPDADVALLEAMVAHISSGQRSSASTANAGTSRGTRLSTREQLKRCKTLSGADASACRAKVCSGRWGADPECPMLPRGASSN